MGTAWVVMACRVGGSEHFWAWGRTSPDHPGFAEVYYCLTPETRVLARNLEWVPVGDLKVGDRLAGFDENPNTPDDHRSMKRRVGNQGKGTTRQWRNAEVLANDRLHLPCYQVRLVDGTTITCSADHQWLVVKNGRWGQGTNKRWVTTRSLYEAQTNPIRDPENNRYLLQLDAICAVQLVETWEFDESRAAGYLAGVFDGEGHLVHRRGRGLRAAMSQRLNSVYRDTESALAELGFGTVITKPRQGTNADVGQIQLKGGVAESLRFLGQCRPGRLLARFERLGAFDNLGRLTMRNKVAFESVEYVGPMEVVGLSTTTRTVVAEGFAHHNTKRDGVTAWSPSGDELPQMGDHLFTVVFPDEPEVAPTGARFQSKPDDQIRWQGDIDPFFEQQTPPSVEAGADPGSA